MAILTQKEDTKTIESQEKDATPFPIKEDDPFFSSDPVDIGLTNNEIIDELLYGMKCQK